MKPEDWLTKNMEEYEVILSSLANKEWLKVIDWYNDKREGLGFEVFDEIDEYLKRLKTLPYINRRVEGEIRLSTTPKFHFGIFYTVKTNTVFVIGIHNLREDYQDILRRV